MSDFPEPNICELKDKLYCYYDANNGKPPLVVLHGMAADKKVMWDSFSKLGDHYRLITLDLPGHDDIPTYNLTSIRDLGFYVNTLIDTLNIENFILAGYSLGGMTALETAYLDGGRKIKGVILWSSPLLGMSEGITKRGKVAYRVFKRLPEKVYNKGLENRAVRHKLGIKLSDLEEEAALKFKYDKRRWIVEMLVAWSHPPLINVPYKFIFDPFDIVIGRKNIKYAESLGNNVSVSVIEHGGHFGSKSGWNKVVDDIKDFLETLT